MSSINDMVVKTNDLVVAIRELINSDTVAAFKEVAAQLGVEQLFKDGVNALATLLRGLHEQLARLEDAVAQFDAVAGVIGLIEPLVMAIGRMAAGGAQEIANYGIPQAQTAVAEIGAGFNYVQSAFDVVQNIAIDADDFSELLDELALLADDVANLATTPAAEEQAA